MFRLLQPTKLNVYKNDSESWDYTSPPPLSKYTNPSEIPSGGVAGYKSPLSRKKKVSTLPN